MNGKDFYVKLASAAQSAAPLLKKILPYGAAAGLGAYGLHKGNKMVGDYQLGKAIREQQEQGPKE
jgi:hypothetical protein